MHEFFSLHTRSPGRFLTTLDLHVQILDALCLWCRCFMRLYASRGPGASPYLTLVSLSFLPSYYFLILDISVSFVIPLLYPYIMHGCLYVLLQWSLIIMVQILYLIQVTLGLACIRGVVSSRVYVADSRRDSVFTYFGKRGVTINYVSEHQLSPIIDASHTTPITHVNQDPMLLKLIGWRHCPCFRWVLYIPGTTTSVSWRWIRSYC